MTALDQRRKRQADRYKIQITWQKQRLLNAWRDLTGTTPNPDEATLLGEAMARLGNAEQAAQEVHQAITTGSYPGLMD